MASSTGIVVTAGVLSFGDLVLSGYNATAGVRVSVATVLAAFISAGLDRVIPGFGTGLAVVLLAGVVFTSGPRIVQKITPVTGLGQ
jgi:hypothetical protein